MPNRVDTPVNGVPPTAARRPEAQQPNSTEDTENRREAAGGDRVKISQEAQARAQAERPTAGGAAGEARLAADTGEPAAQAAETGQQGPSAVEGATAQRAEDLRDQQTAEQQQAAAEPPEQQGNLVDVTG